MRGIVTINEDRGRMSAKAGVSIVVALAVIGLVTSFLVPVALDALQNPDETSFTSVSEGNTVEVKESILNATLDNTAGDETNITVTLTDLDSGDTLTLSNVSDGATSEGTLAGFDVQVTNDDSAAAAADFTVGYEPQYGVGSGASALWNIYDIMIVLAVFLFLVGLALKEL